MTVATLIFVGLSGVLVFLLCVLMALRMAEEWDGKLSHVDEMTECNEND